MIATNRNGWTETVLGTVLHRRRQELQIEETKSYKRVTIRLNSQGVVLRNEALGAEIGTKRQFRVRSGQFILSKIDARNGAFGVVPAECDNAVITGNFWTFDVEPNKLDARYFYFLTRTPLFIDFCVRASEGSTNRRYLQEDRFLSQTLLLPSLTEQRRIVAKIERLAAIIEQAHSLRSQIRVETAVFISSLHFSLSKERTVTMNHLVELDEDRVTLNATTKYPQIGIRGFGGGLFAKASVSGSETSYRYFNRLKQFSLVLSQVKGWEGAIAVCPAALGGYYASPEYRTFRCVESECDPNYLDSVVRSLWFRELLIDATHGQGARRERTRPEMFLTIRLPMPVLSDQQRAVRILSRLGLLKPIHEQTAAELDALLPAILDRAFKGEL